MAGVPRIRISGPPRERGRQLGRAEATRVARAIEVYTGVFDHYAGLSWSQARQVAESFLPPMKAYDEELVAEMAGIAEGASLDLMDIVTLNARTEVMYASGAELPPECTSLAAASPATSFDRVFVGQNWDWLRSCRDLCVVMEIEQPGRPSVMTFTEAGIVGKLGFNSDGLGVAANLLATSEDRGQPGVPVHMLLRSALNASSVPAAVHAITRAERGASGNYIFAAADGTMVDVETGPGGLASVRLIHPVAGILAHTNTFEAITVSEDLGLVRLPDSPLRRHRLGELLDAVRGSIELGDLHQALSDHRGYPSAICRHADDTLGPWQSIVTNASVISDPQAGQLHVLLGNPCEEEYETLVPEFATDSQASLRPSAVVAKGS